MSAKCKNAQEENLRLFSRKRGNKKTYKPRLSEEQLITRQKRKEQEFIWDRFTKEVNNDPELGRQFILRRMNVEAPPPVDPGEKKRQEIRNKLLDQAIRLVDDDEDMRREYAEGMVGEVAAAAGSKLPRRRGGSELYYPDEQGSAISRALEEVESLQEFKSRLEDMGMMKGDGGGNGFLSGIKLTDILAALPIIQAMMSGGGQGQGQVQVQVPVKTYIVNINGQDRELPEPEYRRLLQAGQLRPVAMLDRPKIEAKEKAETEDEGITAIVPDKPKNEPPKVTGVPVPVATTDQGSYKELPPWLNNIDLESLDGWLEMEPQDFVEYLKEGIKNNDDAAKFLWGFLKNTNVEVITHVLIPYRSHPKVSVFIEGILTEEGQSWLAGVIEMIADLKDVVK